MPGLKKEPEAYQGADYCNQCSRQDPQAGKLAHQPAVVLHDDAHADTGDQHDPGEVIRADVANEFCGRRGLDAVVGGHHQEGVDEHHRRGCGLAVP